MLTMDTLNIKDYTISTNENYVFDQPDSLNIDLLKIDYISKKNLTYEHFFQNYMRTNKPCVIGFVADDWKAVQHWVVDNKPDFNVLFKQFGEKSVPVANCAERFYNAQKKEEYTLKQYLDYWKSYISSDYSPDNPCLYLKDWHFTRDCPQENIYRVPEYFSSDWLNEYFTARSDVQDDYRFVYMGPKGSWTPFHADVFSSFSWSVNLCGQKRWVLFPPGQEQCLVDNRGNLAYDVESRFLKEGEVYKNYYKLEKSFEIIQNPGEAIFVPSGWHHQVWNLEDTISINHNWVNGCNIKNMWDSLCNNLTAVKKEISDCKDMENWHEHCQIMLNASYGLDFKQFTEFILYIVLERLKHLNNNTLLKVYGDWFISNNHMKFDVLQAKPILEQLLFNEDFMGLPYFLEIRKEIKNTIEKINVIINRK